ncbi:Hypothetical predicted protein [Podarcis lilfordi]|uniref:Uncharacterized protein n=1 Tax=Podarcis lilfordi TaxID=74358 RepID=A0AA35P4P6_9SAUR|nr:Hypothetical predicted protein [Podarcis lilfordi]
MSCSTICWGIAAEIEVGCHICADALHSYLECGSASSKDDQYNVVTLEFCLPWRCETSSQQQESHIWRMLELREGKAQCNNREKQKGKRQADRQH